MNALTMYSNGGIGDAAQDAAIASASAKLDAAAAALAAKYATGEHTIGALLGDVDKWWRIATEYVTQAKTMSSLTDTQVRAAEDNALTLLELRGYLRSFPASIVASIPMRDKAVAAMVAPIYWVKGIATPILQRSAAYDDMLRAAANAPSTGVNWLLEQLRKSLGLPSWFVPVLATAVVGGVAWWAYSTFLKPAGTGMRLLRNPRRRRRVRRRR